MSTTSPRVRVRSRPGVWKSRRVLRHTIGRLLFFLLVAVILVYILFPFYWAVRSSLMPDTAIYNTPIDYWPPHPTLEHYTQVLTNGNFVSALKNSAIVGLSVTILSLVLGSMGAYVLGRFTFRGRSAALYIILSMTMFPQIAILGALYTEVRALGLYDTLPALIITYLIFTLPFTVWVLTSFFQGMPRELEEAGYVDGANPFQTFYKIMLPLAAPGMVTTGLLALIAAWNEFLYALSFELSPSNYTVPLAIFGLDTTNTSAFDVPWGNIMAATLVVTVPLVILVLIFQRRIVAGLTAGAVKG